MNLQVLLVLTYVRTYELTSSTQLHRILSLTYRPLSLSLTMYVHFYCCSKIKKIHLPHPVIIHLPVGYFLLLIIIVLLVHVIIREGCDSAKTIFRPRYSEQT